MTWAGESGPSESGLFIFTSDGSPFELIGSQDDVLVWNSGTPSFIPQTDLATTGIVTLQTAYLASSSGEIALTSLLGSVKIVDNTSSGRAFSVFGSNGARELLAVGDNIGGTQVDLGSHDSLISGSGEPILRIGDQGTSLQIWPTDRVFTTAPGSLMGLFGTYEHDYPNVSFAGLNLQATMENRQSAFAFNHFLLFNNGLTIKNVNGIAANFGPGQTFIAQPTIQADGASIVMSQNRDFLSQPTFNTINGGALAVTTWSQVQLFGQINTGITMTTRNGIQIGALIGAGGTLTNERGIRLENLARGTTIIGFDSALTGTGKTFINHPGSSPCNFGGDIFMANGISLVLGTAAGNRVELLRSAAGTMRMIGQGGTNNEGLDWDFDPGVNYVQVNSSTGAGLVFDMGTLVFGADPLADPTIANWQALFNPPARTVTAGGDFARRLFSATGALTIDAATTNLFTDIVNEPFATIGAGSVVDAGNLLIQTTPSVGTNRYGLLITSNPTGGTLNYALRVSNGDVRHDGDYEHTGTNWAIHGSTPVAQSAAYTVTSGNVDRSYNADSTTINEIADVLGTLISDLQAKGVVG